MDTRLLGYDELDGAVSCQLWGRAEVVLNNNLSRVHKMCTIILNRVELPTICAVTPFFYSFRRNGIPVQASPLHMHIQIKEPGLTRLCINVFDKDLSCISQTIFLPLSVQRQPAALTVSRGQHELLPIPPW